MSAVLPRDPHREARIEALENQITELAAHIHAATYRLLVLIGEYDACEGWAGPGLNSCAHWLSWKCGMSLGAAREKVRVARSLPSLPLISASFREGRVSYSKVRAMTRVATPENEETLLNVARRGTASHVERVVSHYRRVRRQEALEAENQRHALRELTWYQEDDGSLVIKGRFTPEQGAIIKKALEAALDDDFNERDVSAETPEREEVRPVSELIAQRRADAMLRLAEGYLSQPACQSSGGDRYTLNIHSDIETLKQNGERAEAELEGAAHVSAETSRRMACDAGVIHWKEDKGQPLNLGRRTRTIPPAIRRALKRRDGGCNFPGCSHDRFVDAHHVKHWADGGETSMDNLVLLCRTHHRLVHEGGFSMHAQDGDFYFVRPNGEILPQSAHTGRFRGNVVELTRQNAELGLRITPNTPVPSWLGERMDYSTVLERLDKRKPRRSGARMP